MPAMIVAPPIKFGKQKHLSQTYPLIFSIYVCTLTETLFYYTTDLRPGADGPAVRARQEGQAGRVQEDRAEAGHAQDKDQCGRILNERTNERTNECERRTKMPSFSPPDFKLA